MTVTACAKEVDFMCLAKTYSVQNLKQAIASRETNSLHSQQFRGKKSCISFCKMLRNKQHLMKALLNSLHLNGHKRGFHADLKAKTSF